MQYHYNVGMSLYSMIREKVVNDRIFCRQVVKVGFDFREEAVSLISESEKNQVSRTRKTC
jgi:hypothetical protein